MGNWAELVEDLLFQVVRKIPMLEDFVAFGGVCRTWRSVAVKENYKGSQQIPWLMLSEEEDNGSGERRFVSLTKGMIRTSILPEAKGKRCLESLGWFVTVSEDGEMNLLHPLSRLQIGLPHINTFKYYEKGIMQTNYIFIRKAVLSSTPDLSGKDYVVMVIYGGCGWLGFWKPGDKTWTTIETRLAPFYDLCYYKGQFYGVDAAGRIFACEVWGPNQTLAQLVCTLPREFTWTRRAYLVESKGALLVVLRDGWQLDFLGDYGDDPNYDPDNADESRIDYGAKEFLLLEVNLSNGGWTEKKILGANSLFLGDNSSISVDVSKFPGIKPNCIYYTDDNWEPYVAFKRGGGKDMGIFNLDGGSITPYYIKESFSRICPPIWVNPSF